MAHLPTQRCGVACGEPPTSGDMQSARIDCIAIKSVETCRDEVNAWRSWSLPAAHRSSTKQVDPC